LRSEQNRSPPDPDLSRVVASWPRLSEDARRMILAAVDAAIGKPG
jgi:hypothetical protein